jgi:hypothetical protein
MGTGETPDNPLEEFLHGLGARPYTGVEIAVPTQGEQRQTQLNYLVGMAFSNDPEFKSSFIVEYIEGEGAILPGDRRAVKLGFRTTVCATGPSSVFAYIFRRFVLTGTWEPWIMWAEVLEYDFPIRKMEDK